MTKHDIVLLKAKIDKGTAKIRFIDGEEIIAKILSVSEHEQDVIYDVITTSHRKTQSGQQSARLARFDEIDSVS